MRRPKRFLAIVVFATAYTWAFGWNLHAESFAESLLDMGVSVLFGMWLAGELSVRKEARDAD